MQQIFLFVPFGTGLYAIFRKKSMDFRITFIDNDRSYTVFHRPGNTSIANRNDSVNIKNT